MRYSVERKQFIDYLTLIQSIINPRSTLPILSHVHLTAQVPDQLVLFATDLQTTLKIILPATVEEGGTTTLPARRLLTIIRELDSDHLLLKTDSRHQTTLSSGKAFFQLNGLPDDDYPKFTTENGIEGLTLSQGKVRKMLRMVQYAMADESRPALNGAWFSIKSGRFEVAVTDGKRLAYIFEEIDNEGIEAEGIVPAKAVLEISRILEGSDKTLKLFLDSNKIFLQFENILFFSKLTEGKYPNFKQVIPKTTTQKAVIDRNSFIHAIRRVSSIAISGSSAPPIFLDFLKTQELVLSCQASEIGKAQETLSLKAFEGEPFSIPFNPLYLIEPLREMEKEDVTLQFVNPTTKGNPCLITEGTNFVYVLMPIKNQ
ncbi:DNA polymerase III subunit beta [Methylacidiphilum caldifontis]|uniref:Beta sliding clamp n=1 Tax=Methylacidiphilum caldifontis TaxID=2795386 RepID=A0A4Y8PE29_9BACT|nr:DNA polymerase III subunit beta [Methylacidiphilum caldifontis]QSR88036.1 DNA polymerase III subunit beta [Methylacidiphilum caldifontis]TFE69571.1 DNA polymerase III subunit beta [Methylacidiphilum caldifontis]